MNPNTNHLIALGDGEQPPPGYEILPSELQHAARLKLAGKKEATVSRRSGGKLSRWAAARRRENKNRRRRTQRRSKACRFPADYCN